MEKKYKNRGAFMMEKDRMIVCDEDNVEQFVDDPAAVAKIRRQLEVVLPVDPDKVLIKVECVGVCGSDVHYFHDGRCGSFEVTKENIPYMLGHECSGTIVEVGANVKNLKVGDRVCCEPSVTCGKCEHCKSGHYNLCEDVVFWATPPVEGCYMQYVPFQADYCFKLPDNMDAEEGALIEPFAIGMYAAQMAEVTVGSTVAIMGSGCIGLMTLLGCKARGASQIIVCDLEDIRLDKAKELGADIVINSRREDPLKKIDEITNGRGVDVVLETAGSRFTIAQTPFLARRGGLIVLVGISADEEIKYNFGQVMAKELQIKSIFRYVNMYPKSIAAVSSGLAPVKKVASHRYPLADIQQAFDDSVNKKNEVVKAVVMFD